MRTLRFIAFAALAVVSVAAFAAASMLKVTKQVTINAPADDVWAKIKNFDSLDKWHPAVEKDQIVAGRISRVGRCTHAQNADFATRAAMVAALGRPPRSCPRRSRTSAAGIPSTVFNFPAITTDPGRDGGPGVCARATVATANVSRTGMTIRLAGCINRRVYDATVALRLR